VLSDSGRRACLREDRAELIAFVQQARPLRGFSHLSIVADFHPQLTLVGFFEDDAKAGGEFCVRATAAGAPIVAGHA
jgi:hypothetical protein